MGEYLSNLLYWKRGKVYNVSSVEVSLNLGPNCSTALCGGCRAPCSEDISKSEQTCRYQSLRRRKGGEWMSKIVKKKVYQLGGVRYELFKSGEAGEIA